MLSVYIYKNSMLFIEHLCRIKVVISETLFVFVMFYVQYSLALFYSLLHASSAFQLLTKILSAAISLHALPFALQ